MYKQEHMRHPRVPSGICSWYEELCAGVRDDKLAHAVGRVHMSVSHLPEPTVSLQLPLLPVEV